MRTSCVVILGYLSGSVLYTPLYQEVSVTNIRIDNDTEAVLGR